MNRSLSIGLLIGLAVGAIAGALVARSRNPETPKPVAPPPAPPTSIAPKESATETEVATLRKRVAELEAGKATPKDETPETSKDPEPEGTPDEAADLATAFDDLVGHGLGGYKGSDFNKLVQRLLKDKPKALQLLADRLLNGATANERFFAAALMEEINDPAAIPALAQSLQNEREFLSRRMTSHALAMIGTEGGLAALRKAMAEDKDWGVRMNSAYGVAKQGQEDGQRALESYWTSPTSTGEEKLVALFVLADIAAPSSAPIFRKILSESSEATQLIQAIGALEKMKDAAAAADLVRIAGDSRYPSKVREAAKKAADSLAK